MDLGTDMGSPSRTFSVMAMLPTVIHEHAGEEMATHPVLPTGVLLLSGDTASVSCKLCPF